MCEFKNKRETFMELMLKTGELANDIGTILVGKEAVDYGLIDEIGGIKEALNMLHNIIRGKRKKVKNNVIYNNSYEVIFEKRDDIPTNYIELKMGNKQLVVAKLSNGNYLIQSMYSTNPLII